jgi:uncharacterized membrane protein YvbJ
MSIRLSIECNECGSEMGEGECFCGDCLQELRDRSEELEGELRERIEEQEAEVRELESQGGEK